MSLTFSVQNKPSIGIFIGLFHFLTLDNGSFHVLEIELTTRYTCIVYAMQGKIVLKCILLMIKKYSTLIFGSVALV